MRMLSSGALALAGHDWLARPLVNGGLEFLAGVGVLVAGCRGLVLRLYLASKRAWVSRQPSSELAEGAGLLTLRSGFDPRGMRAWPLTVGASPRWSCGGGHLLAGAAAPGGDVGVPGGG